MINMISREKVLISYRGDGLDKKNGKKRKSLILMFIVLYGEIKK